MVSYSRFYFFAIYFYNVTNSVLQNLYHTRYWEDVFLVFEKRSFRQKEKLSIYRQILEDESYREIAREVLSKNYKFQMPLRLVVNKLQTGKKKTVYLFGYQDDFLLKVINKILTETYQHLISPACHSFQRGKGAKTAFRMLLADPEIDKKHFLKTDIHNFFNSVNIEDFISILPDEIKADGLLFGLLEQILVPKYVRLSDGSVISEDKGLMAGCPLSPFLSNIYLNSLDQYFARKNVTYTRYSDDIVIFDHKDKIENHFSFIKKYLSDKGLCLNQDKTFIGEPGKEAVFLGFSYKMGTIDLSPVSVEKMKGKIKRLSRSYNRRLKRGKMSETGILEHFIGRINRKLYGINARENDLCWAHWFFPVINTVESIEFLDKYIQDRLRYSVTGKYNRANYRKVPYSRLVQCGYIPLIKTFWKFKTDYSTYQKMIEDKENRNILQSI